MKFPEKLFPKLLPWLILLVVAILIYILIRNNDTLSPKADTAPAANETAITVDSSPNTSVEPPKDTLDDLPPLDEPPDIKEGFTPRERSAEIYDSLEPVAGQPEAPSSVPVLMPDPAIDHAMQQMERLQRQLEQLKSDIADKVKRPSGNPSSALARSRSSDAAAASSDTVAAAQRRALLKKIRDLKGEVAHMQRRLDDTAPPPAGSYSGDSDARKKTKKRPDFSPGYQPGRSRYIASPLPSGSYPPQQGLSADSESYQIDGSLTAAPRYREPVTGHSGTALVMKPKKLFVNQPIRLFNEQVLINLSEVQQNRAGFDLSLPSIDYLRWENMKVGDRRILFFQDKTYFVDILGIGFNSATLSISMKM